MSSQSPPPPAPSTLSPDGNYRWDGSQWQAVQQPPPPPGPTAPQPPVGTAAPLVPPPGEVKEKGHKGRNVVLGIVGLIVLIVIINMVSGGNKSTSTSTPAAPATPAGGAAAAPAKPVAPAPIAPIQLSGTGQQATSPFTVTSGLAIITAACNCSGNFSIELLDSTGQTKDVAVNVIGSYSGSVGEGLDAGAYSLKISADAPWTVTITQPRGVAGASLPHTYTGKGQQTVGPFSAGNAARLQAQNTSAGGSNFSVEVLGNDGHTEDVSFNEIGSFSGSTVSNGLSGGPFYLKVNSDGSWTISVSNP